MFSLYRYAMFSGDCDKVVLGYVHVYTTYSVVFAHMDIYMVDNLDHGFVSNWKCGCCTLGGQPELFCFSVLL